VVESGRSRWRSPGAGEDGAGVVEMRPVAARSGTGGWMRRRGLCSRGRVRERTGGMKERAQAQRPMPFEAEAE
jgi:hypothetical protein